VGSLVLTSVPPRRKCATNRVTGWTVAASRDVLTLAASRLGTRPRHTTSTFCAVEAFAAPYRLIDLVGTGGMGSVWRAWDLRRGAYVAAKVLGQHDAAKYGG
jgi:serine/threonine protein kinase